jgi:hypothetical protein
LQTEVAGRSGEGSVQMKGKRWLQKVADKEEWAPVIKEAKDIRGP